jgi:hypothetical protein
MELTKQHNILQPTIHFEYVEDFSKHLIEKMIHGAKLTEDGKVYSDSTIRQYKSFLRSTFGITIYSFENLCGSKIRQ